MTPPDRPIPVSVLGATGVVGQRFVARLAAHPSFRIEHLAASDRNRGKPYARACAWRVTGGGADHAGLGGRELRGCTPDEAFAPVVFSALDSRAAAEIEGVFAAAGALVFSNAGAHRMDPDVPLVVPEVNPDHLDLLETQRAGRGWTGGIVCNPNCTTAILATALAPLHATFGVEQVSMTSMQALSGAGHPGVASLDALGNVLPHIPEEEEKVAEEAGKLLGLLEGGAIAPAALTVSAACHRVPVIDGHMEAVSVKLAGDPSPEVVREAFEAWRPLPQELGLPSAPAAPIVVHQGASRPQPRLDVDHDGGMSVHVGRIRPCPILGTRFVVLGHNLERGAAGGSVLNAELARARELV